MHVCVCVCVCVCVYKFGRGPPHHDGDDPERAVDEVAPVVAHRDEQFVSDRVALRDVQVHPRLGRVAPELKTDQRRRLCP